MAEVRHLSYSSVNLYMTCPRAWKFRYVEKIKTPRGAALIFGSAFHSTIQNYLAALYGERETVINVPTAETFPSLLEVWDYEWSRELARKQEVVYGTNESPEILRETGRRMIETPDLMAALSQIKPITGIPYETWKGTRTGPMMEARINASIPGMPVKITGLIDIMCDDQVPLDIKTAGKMWSKGQEHTELQADFYLAAQNQAGWKGNTELRFRYLIITKAKTPKVQLRETTRTFGQLMWMFSLVKDTWNAIKLDVFPPRVGGWKCSEKWCEFWPHCRGKAI